MRRATATVRPAALDKEGTRIPAVNPGNDLPSHIRRRTAGHRLAGMDKSRDELYQEARRLQISGRSSMSKEELAVAVQGARR